MGGKSSKRAGYWIDRKAVAQAMGKVNGKVAEWTADAIQKTAKSKLKTMVRKKKSGWERSLPGEPPRKITGRLQGSIRYGWDNGNQQFVVGPIFLGGNPSGKQPVPNVLQFGGNATLRRKVWIPTPVRKFSPDSVRDQNINKYHQRRKNRPMTVKGKRKGGEKYRYFYSRKRWENASQSPDFLKWCESRRVQWEPYSVTIAPRPFMDKALNEETAPEKMKGRYERARDYFAKAFKRTKR